MIPPANAIQTEGHGVDLVLLHGTGAGKSIWRPLTVLLRERFRVTAYDRRGTSAWPIAVGGQPPLVSDHVDDAVDLIARLGTAPVHVCGISFGASIALELTIRKPELVRSAVLFEPAIAGDGVFRSPPKGWTDEIERLVGLGEPARAAEHFFRRLLGEKALDLLPLAVRNEMAGSGHQIRYDLLANAAHRVDNERLRQISTPVLLLQGGRSSRAFDAPIRALRSVLPQSQHAVIRGARHVPFGAAWSELAEALTAFLCV